MLRSNRSEAPQGVVRLLPAFDEYVLGWRDRGLAVAAEHRAKVNRGGGWLHPVLVVDGQIVAMWRSATETKQLRIDLAPFAPITAATKRAVATEAKDVAAYLGVRVVLGS